MKALELRGETSRCSSQEQAFLENDSETICCPLHLKAHWHTMATRSIADTVKQSFSFRLSPERPGFHPRSFRKDGECHCGRPCPSSTLCSSKQSQCPYKAHAHKAETRASGGSTLCAFSGCTIGEPPTFRDTRRVEIPEHRREILNRPLVSRGPTVRVVGHYS